MSETDLELLKRYAREHAEDAFAEIVRRHIDLVYSAALRQVRSPQIAEEVSQSVFADLARYAHRFAPDTILTAWLYQVTRRTAIDVVRREARRHLREQIATEMNAINAPAAGWMQIEPMLDEAMAALDDTDRAAVLLRYFENKSLREVGQTLGVSDDAAQKRVSRAVEHLREFFAKHGVAVSASGLVALTSANAVQAAPVGLAVTISTAAALAALSLPAPIGVGAGTGFLGALSQFFRSNLGAGLAATVFVGLATLISYRAQHRVEPGAARDSSPTISANPRGNLQTATSTTLGANVAEEQRQPDPLKLLRAVAQARQWINSGAMELQLSTDRFQRGRKETTQRRLTVLFDGVKLRFEMRAREYKYKYSANEAEAAEIVKRADSMSREAAARAGLLEEFEAHVVTASDGATLVRYRNYEGKQGSTTVEDPVKGSANSAEYFFDPRCLGLYPSLSFGCTLEGCLRYNGAKSIRLMGEEAVEGVPAWHVQVQTQSGLMLDFWIEVAHPTRVLQQAEGRESVLSKYDDANLRDPIPIELTTWCSYPNGRSYTTKFTRTSTQFNVPVDPVSFTLAGLGMPVGTPVADIRIYRDLGCWTGTGLTEFPPGKSPASQPSPPSLAEQLTVLENYPALPEALKAATWILLNTPDGPEVEKAAEVIQREHTRDTNLVSFCTELERMRHRCSKELLETLLKNNPSADVRGTACFALATMLKDEAKYGQNTKAIVEAEKQFERVITEFGQVTQRGYTLAELANPELSELRRLIVGKPAPEIEAKDLEGRPMKLSDFRGKVVVLTFWCPLYIEAPAHRKLVERLEGKPFAFVGVYVDDDLAKGKAEVEKYGITWPSFWDKRDGPISTNWNVRSWPNIWVLDRQGVIRYRQVRWRDLDDAVDALLRE